MGLLGYNLSAPAAAAAARYDASRAKAVEGEPREGPYHLPVTGGWLSAEAGQYANYWQMGYDPQTGSGSAIVQACVSAYAQTTAMCPGSHWKMKANGGRERVTNSALSRILVKPNAYQSPSDFLLNLTSLLYRHGNAYAVAVRNARFEIVELHLMHSGCAAAVASTGEIFYSLSGNEVIERQFAALGYPNALSAVPSRDVLHVRLETPRHPLKGETPLTANMLDLAMSSAMARQMLAFFDRQARPSGVLATEKDLDLEQIKMLREAWELQSRGLNAGGTPILGSGLKWFPMTTQAKDMQFAEILKMTDQNVALAYRVPLQILGVGDTPFASTGSLMGSWLSQGLGFALNHIEQAFDRLFGLAGAPAEYTELDTSILMRSDFKSRVEGWKMGVDGGFFAANDARREFELDPAAGGDEPRVQQQDVPLSWAQEQPTPAALPPPPPADDVPSAEEQQRAFVALFEKDLREAVNV